MVHSEYSTNVASRPLRTLIDGLSGVVRWFMYQNRWVWLIPIPFYEFVRKFQGKLHFLIAGLIAVGFALLVGRKPVKALMVLVVLLPFDTYLLGGLLHLGMPTTVLRPIRFWQYGIVAGLLIALLRDRQHRARRLDLLDKVAFGYLILGALYLVLPKLFVGSAFGSQLTFYQRELGWRSDVMYVAVFLIVRRLWLNRDQAERAVRALLITGTIVAVLGIFEFIDKNEWNHLAVKTFEITRYEQVILKYVPSPSFNPNSVLTDGSLGGHHFVRIGSVLDYESLGFYMALCLGFAAETIARGRARPWIVASMMLMAIALLLTQTRSGYIAGVVAVVVALRNQIGRSILHRVRLTLTVGLVVVAALPFIVIGGVGHRFFGATDNSLHRGAFHNGVNAMVHSPMGRGLATSAGAGQQASASGGLVATGLVYNPASPPQGLLVTESQWLEIGTQLGVIGLAIFVALCLLMIKRLRPRGPTELAGPAGLPSAGARNAFIGLLIGGSFLQPFINQPLSFTTFLMIGIGVGLMDQVAASSDSSYPDNRGRPVGATIAARPDARLTSFPT